MAIKETCCDCIVIIAWHSAIFSGGREYMEERRKEGGRVPHSDGSEDNNDIFIRYSATSTIVRGASQHYNLKDIKRYMYAIRQILLF